MKIDRHNYEEFFLLYVDNELTVEQKKSVDEFVQQNPDLAIELEILQQTTLTADESVVFDGKEMLFKKETSSVINLSNYEEYLISYIDNELTDAERIAFFNFVTEHPQVKEELAIYQQTKLQPETEIVFENKQVLYRKEEKVKVITMQWWKIAVAAAVLVAAGITTIKVINNNNNKPVIQPTVAGTNKTNTEKKNTTEKTNEALKNEQTKAAGEEQAAEKNTDNIAVIIEQKKKERNTPAQKSNEQKIQRKFVAPEIKENNESLAVNNTKAAKNDNETTSINKDNTKSFDAVIKKETAKATEVAVNTDLPKENINKKPVTPATDEPLDIKEIDQDNTSKDQVASYDEGKNKKLRGFFRKASRVFERRTNISAADEEEKQDKVLIGALAVKLK